MRINQIKDNTTSSNNTEQDIAAGRFGQMKGNSISAESLEILKNTNTANTVTHAGKSQASTDTKTKGVKVTGDDALKMIADGLSTEEKNYVRLDSDGFIDQEFIQQGLSALETPGENFNSLVTLVNGNTILDVSVASTFTTETGTHDMGQLTYESDLDVMYSIEGGNMEKEEYAKTHPQYSAEKEWGGLIGITFYGDKDTGFGKSADGNTHVVVNKNLLNPAEEYKREGLKEMASNFAHEAYGHALFKQQGKQHSHGPKKSLTDDMNGEVNLELEQHIYAREKEAEQNFEKNNPK